MQSAKSQVFITSKALYICGTTWLCEFENGVVPHLIISFSLLSLLAPASFEINRRVGHTEHKQMDESKKTKKLTCRSTSYTPSCNNKRCPLCVDNDNACRALSKGVVWNAFPLSTRQVKGRLHLPVIVSPPPSCLPTTILPHPKAAQQKQLRDLSHANSLPTLSLGPLAESI